MKKLIFILFTLSIFKGNAQEAKFADKEFYLVDSLILDDLSKYDLNTIDSCLKIYHSTTIDTIKWNSLNFIASSLRSEIWYQYQKIATQLVEEKLKEQLSDEEKKSYLLKKANNLNNEGYWLANNGKLNQSIKLYEEAIEILRKYKAGKLANKLYNLGSNYIKIGQINKAIPLLEEAIIIAKNTNNKNTGLFIANLAMHYNTIGRTKDAIDFLTEALEYNKINSDEIQQAVIYSNLGTISRESTQNYKEAIIYFNKSLSIYKKLNDKRLTARTLDILGYTHIAAPQPDTTLAINYLKDAILLANEVNDIGTLSSTHHTLSKIYYHKSKIDSSLYYANKAYNFALKSNILVKRKTAAQQLSKIYTRKNNYKKALEFQIDFEKMKDSINNKEINFTLAKTQAKLQYQQEKELSDIQHQNELIVKQKENEKQALYKQVFIFGSIILLIIILIILKQFSKSVKQKKTIEQSNIQLEEQHKEITSSITYAKRIQSAILPPNQTVKENFHDSFLIYKPKDIVSGDFYWLEKKGEIIFFAVADCTGHGVPGAMVSVICNNGLNRSVREHQLQLSNEILDKTREIVIQEFEKSGEDIKDGMDISLIAWNKTTNTIQFSGAHNPLWIIRTQNNKPELIELKGDKQPIGNFERSFPFTLQSFQLQKGDTVYLSSDGFADQFGGKRNKKIKNVNFKKLLIQNFHLPMPEQQKILEQFFIEWKGDNEQLDDVCIAGIRF